MYKWYGLKKGMNFKYLEDRKFRYAKGRPNFLWPGKQ